ncbi:MAG TPA: tetratricopeptide repeat protein [Bacteroidota bacterium]|nr:tetratricopeptide repeat protein [Bacteroidota bacterium]
MKTCGLGCVALAASVSLLFFSCATDKGSESRDEYFPPVSRVVTVSADGKDTLAVLTRHSHAQAFDTVRSSMIEMMKEQNKRLDAVVQQLNMLTQQSITTSTNTSLAETLASHDRFTNETLIEMIRDQNQRLNEVVEQLKSLADNQQRFASTNAAANIAVPTTPQQIHPAKQLASASVPVVLTWATASLQYGKAIKLYEAGKYAKAIRAFRTILKHRSVGALADRCYFWIGVSQLSLHHPSQAIAALTKVFSYPHSFKIESTYFMLGQCYEQSGMPSMAKSMFNKMLQEYPKSSLKAIAEKKIALLN